MLKEGNSDYLLWKQIKSGNAEAFQELYRIYADILFAFGTIFTRDHELVKDCIHDLIFDLYKYRKNLSDNDNIKNYLFKALKRRIQSSSKNKLTIVYGEHLNGDDLQDENDDASEEQLKMEQINRLINQLPDKQREMIKLRYQLEMPYHEISTLMDISVESVRTSIYRSIKSLREQLEGQDFMFFFIFTKNYKMTSK